MDDQLEGFHSGAFEYIVKPFSMEILKFKIDSLFNFRKEIQERLKSIKNINSIQTLDISKHDINFLKKCAKIIEDNILTKKIGIPELCEELGMSKTQLYNKMKAITDKSIGDFIREVKLNIAARMLVEERLSISEVTLNVGFSNRSHFAKCFKDYFGENPADYIKNTLEKQKRDLI
jgi:AraC-like DNA-binding protein